MIEIDDLLVLFGKMRAGFENLQNIPQQLRRTSDGQKIHWGNTIEQSIAQRLESSLFEVAKSLDDLADYIWETYVTDQDTRLEEDAIYLAQEEARKKFGQHLAVICVERLPTEYASKIRWRVTMRLPEQDES